MLCLDIHSLKGSYQRVNCCNLIWIHPKKIFRIQKMHSLAFTCFYLVGFKICLCELHAALPLFQPGFWKSEAETKAEGKAEGQDGKSRTYQVGRPSHQRGIKSLEVLTSYIYIYRYLNVLFLICVYDMINWGLGMTLMMWLLMMLLIHCSIVALLGKDGKGAEETGKSSKGKEPGKDAW